MVQPFVPEFLFVEPDALEYPLARRLVAHYRQLGIPIRSTTSHNQVRGIPGDSEQIAYRNAKKTLVLGVRRTLTFEPSKPSAEYALPLATGCMGHCHYCYLQTTLGKKPYIRIYVNVEEILEQAARYIARRAPEVTRFEAACTSDPVGLEHISGSLKRAIEFMADQPLGRLRFVTKYAHVEPLLDARHNGHTRFRFSMNTDYVIRHFEPATSRYEERLEAARKVAGAGYPLGFVLAPLIRYPGWQEGYAQLVRSLAETLPPEAKEDLTFELIQHRFTKTAKNIILQRYPRTKLEMDEDKRKVKYGRYGRAKYVYPTEEAAELESHLRELLNTYFPEARIEYFT